MGKKVIKANSKCPLCGEEAYVSFMTTECSNGACDNFREGVVSKADYALLEANDNPGDEPDGWQKEKPKEGENMYDSFYWYREGELPPEHEDEV